MAGNRLHDAIQQVLCFSRAELQQSSRARRMQTSAQLPGPQESALAELRAAAAEQAGAPLTEQSVAALRGALTQDWSESRAVKELAAMAVLMETYVALVGTPPHQVRAMMLRWKLSFWCMRISLISGARHSRVV